MSGIRMLRAQGSGLLGSLSTGLFNRSHYHTLQVRPWGLKCFHPSAWVMIMTSEQVLSLAVFWRWVVCHACCPHCKENLAPHKGRKLWPQMCLGLLLFLLFPLVKCEPLYVDKFTSCDQRPHYSLPLAFIYTFPWSLAPRNSVCNFCDLYIIWGTKLEVQKQEMVW